MASIGIFCRAICLLFCRRPGLNGIEIILKLKAFVDGATASATGAVILFRRAGDHRSRTASLPSSVLLSNGVSNIRAHYDAFRNCCSDTLAACGAGVNIVVSNISDLGEMKQIL